MKFRGLVGAVSCALLSCFLLSCGKASRNISSTDTMYVVAQGSAQVWGFRANFNNGLLSLINSAPFATKPSPSRMVIEPSNNFAYVTVIDPGVSPQYAIQRFSIDANGTFISLGDDGISNTPITAMIMDSAGKFLLAARSADSTTPACVTSCISVFSVSNGSLSEVAGSPFPVTNPTNPPGVSPSISAMALQSSLNLLYVADQTNEPAVYSNGAILTYQFDPSSGTLSSPLTLPPVATGLAPSAMAIDAKGAFLYVTNRDSATVSGFTITPGTQAFPGSLQPIKGSPFSAGLGPVAVVIDPSVQFVYVADHDSNQVSGYSLTAATGVLKPVSDSPFNPGLGPSFLAISPTNKYLYTSNSLAGTVSIMGIEPGSGNVGAAAPVSAGINPMQIAFGR
jgi:6-phosphogluconolactonase